MTTTALITGATSGISRAAADKLVQSGVMLAKAGMFFGTTRVRIQHAAWQRLFSHVVARGYSPWAGAQRVDSSLLPRPGQSVR